MVAAAVEEDCSPHGGQEADNKIGVVARHNSPRHNPNDLLLPEVSTTSQNSATSWGPNVQHMSQRGIYVCVCVCVCTYTHI
jgi:hypothetical protein